MSVATATQGESYVYGGVLFQRVSESKPLGKPPRVGFATSLWQGLYDWRSADVRFCFASASIRWRNPLQLFVRTLGVWTAFLIARCPVTYRLFDFLKEEVHYYLID
jgi:hypothetical protein